jgi:hypothetical protein
MIPNGGIDALSPAISMKRLYDQKVWGKAGVKQ